jgi:hypothetical protein
LSAYANKCAKQRGALAHTRRRPGRNGQAHFPGPSEGRR